MHRAILSIVDPSIKIDHVNGNGLDNRKHNLRICSVQQNGANRAANRNNSLGIKGVHRTKYGKFRAIIKVNWRQVHLGNFSTKEEAHAAYVEAAKKYFGEFAHG